MNTPSKEIIDWVLERPDFKWRWNEEVKHDLIKGGGFSARSIPVASLNYNQLMSALAWASGKMNEHAGLLFWWLLRDEGRRVMFPLHRATIFTIPLSLPEQLPRQRQKEVDCRRAKGWQISFGVDCLSPTSLVQGHALLAEAQSIFRPKKLSEGAIWWVPYDGRQGQQHGFGESYNFLEKDLSCHSDQQGKDESNLIK